MPVCFYYYTVEIRSDRAWEQLKYGLSIQVWPYGHATDIEDALRFTKLQNVDCMVETFPLSKANDAFSKSSLLPFYNLSLISRYEYILTHSYFRGHARRDSPLQGSHHDGLRTAAKLSCCQGSAKLRESWFYLHSSVVIRLYGSDASHKIVNYGCERQIICCLTSIAQYF